MTVELRPYGVTCNIQCQYCYQHPQRDAGNQQPHYDLAGMKAAIEREGGPFTLFGGEALLLPKADKEALWAWGLEKLDLGNFAWIVGDFNTDGIADLYLLKIRNTAAGNLEVHVLDGASHFQNFLVRAGTPIIARDADTFLFGVGDYNKDGIGDLYAIRRQNTQTGNLEVHVLNGAVAAP